MKFTGIFRAPLRALLPTMLAAPFTFAAAVPAWAQGAPPVGAGNSIWRDYTVDGVSASGVWNPRKPDIRTWASQVESTINLGLAISAQTWVTTSYGMACDGVTDDSTAWNTLLTTASNAGGGTIVVAGGCRVDNATTFATDGGAGTSPTTMPRQKPIRITGASYDSDSSLYGRTPSGGSFLDLRYAGSGNSAKIDTRGAGNLEIDHLVIKDGSTSNYPFIKTTNTTLNLHDLQFVGNSSCYGSTCQQDIIILGDLTSTSLWSGAAASGFQGYGTRIQNVQFSHCRRAISFGYAANSVYVANPLVDESCGSSEAKGAPIYFSGKNPAQSQGNMIVGGAVELTNYAYGVWYDGASPNQSYYNSIVGTSFWDPGAGTIAAVYYDTSARWNTFQPAYFPPSHVGGAAILTVDGPGAAQNMLIANNGVQGPTFPVALTVGPLGTNIFNSPVQIPAAGGLTTGFIAGGTATNATLSLQGSSAGSPSGDQISFRANGAQVAALSASTGLVTNGATGVSGFTALGVAGRVVVDQNGGGTNLIDGTHTTFRTYAGASLLDISATYAQFFGGINGPNLPRTPTGSALGAVCFDTSNNFYVLTAATLCTGSFGTGVSAALGVNVGSPGAFVVNGGAGGTPSSLTLTNALGLPVGGIAAIAANTVVANVTSGSASPTAAALPSCATSASALNYTSGTGFSCNTAVAAPAGSLTGATLAAGVTGSSLTSVGTIGTGVWQGTVVAAQYGGTGVNNSGKTITLGANLTTTGGATTLAMGATGRTYTFPDTAGTVPLLALAQTWSANQTFNSGNFLLAGATSGTLTIKPAATAGANTLTLPAGTTDFSATGGSNQVVQQSSVGGALTVGQLSGAALSSGALVNGMTATTQAANDNSSKLATTAYSDGGAWSTYTPTIACGTGSITTLGSVTGRYLQRGKTYDVEINIPITTNGTCAATITATLPNSATAIAYAAIVGKEWNATGAGLAGFVAPSGSIFTITNSAGGYPGANAANLVLSGRFEAN